MCVVVNWVGEGGGVGCGWGWRVGLVLSWVGCGGGGREEGEVRWKHVGNMS